MIKHRAVIKSYCSRLSFKTLSQRNRFTQLPMPAWGVSERFAPHGRPIAKIKLNRLLSSMAAVVKTKVHFAFHGWPIANIKLPFIPRTINHQLCCQGVAGGQGLGDVEQAAAGALRRGRKRALLFESAISPQAANGRRVGARPRRKAAAREPRRGEATGARPLPTGCAG